MSGFHYEHTETTLAEAAPTPWKRTGSDGTEIVDVSGRPVGTAVDWRQAEAIVAAMNEHERMAERVIALNAEIVELHAAINREEDEAYSAREAARVATQRAADAAEEVRDLKAKLAKHETGSAA